MLIDAFKFIFAETQIKGQICLNLVHNKTKFKYVAIKICTWKTIILFKIHSFVFIMYSILFTLHIVGARADKNQEPTNYLEFSCSILNLRMSKMEGSLMISVKGDSQSFIWCNSKDIHMPSTCIFLWIYPAFNNSRIFQSSRAISIKDSLSINLLKSVLH